MVGVPVAEAVALPLGVPVPLGDCVKDGLCVSVPEGVWLCVRLRVPDCVCDWLGVRVWLAVGDALGL